MISFRLREIVEVGEPLFESEEINNGIQAVPNALDLLSASVKVLNNSLVREILGTWNTS